MPLSLGCTSTTWTSWSRLPVAPAAIYEKVYIRAFTPEGLASTHVFWQVAHNYATDDVAVTEHLRAVHEQMQLEDKPLA
jgi:Vanillate O-demethylase oxygenase C-terminal domain